LNTPPSNINKLKRIPFLHSVGRESAQISQP